MKYILAALVLVLGQCSAYNFDQFNKYNAIMFGNYQGSSDVQGRLCVGGDADLHPGFSVGDMINDIQNCNDYSFICNGKINWPSGRNYHGNIGVSVEGNYQLGEGINDGCSQVSVNPHAFDFNGAKTYFSQTCDKFAGMNPTAALPTLDESLSGSFQFTGAAVEVINVHNPHYFGAELKHIAGISNLRAGATIIFNILGEDCSLSNMNMEAFAGLDVVFNFPQATKLTIGGIAVRGSVIAPKAHCPDATGVIHGHVVVDSMTGPCQINWVGPPGPVPPAPVPPPPGPIKCRIRPPAPTETCPPDHPPPPPPPEETCPPK
ncbi:hypothetical protein MP638_007488 [Amoeboaphelidium occidentale]|nr:hypothetical protein MP638_007488 [Amoeboaphelidium occidentale]